MQTFFKQYKLGFASHTISQLLSSATATLDPPSTMFKLMGMAVFKKKKKTLFMKVGNWPAGIVCCPLI